MQARNKAVQGLDFYELFGHSDVLLQAMTRSLKRAKQFNSGKILVPSVAR